MGYCILHTQIMVLAQMSESMIGDGSIKIKKL